MTSAAENPDACTTMEQVRHGIDRLDREIIALIGERFRYVEAAARIKGDVNEVRDELRIAEVIANARRAAASAGVPSEVATELYRLLIESSVVYELEKFERGKRVGAASAEPEQT